MFSSVSPLRCLLNHPKWQLLHSDQCRLGFLGWAKAVRFRKTRQMFTPQRKCSLLMGGGGYRNVSVSGVFFGFVTSEITLFHPSYSLDIQTPSEKIFEPFFF